ncbi:Predicted arabinose efflux permease, MFS family [Rhizobiales bacterium GAS188]|nr:Predicted arabinose efflux permease, MFS family [Rhizobiales bacterium GAS188]
MAHAGASVDSARPTSTALRPKAQSTVLNVTAAILGNALEFFDFAVYSAYAVFLGKAFFPTGNAFTSLLFSVATFGVGFVTRPLGGAVIGAYADRHGRKPAMTLTIWLMAVGTGIIGLLPTYETIGIAAPILLVLARLLQGFSTGGEMGPATTYLVESAPLRRRGLFGSWQLASQNLGAVFAALVGVSISQALPESDIQSFGWRIPFFIGLVIAPVGIYIRNRIDETLDVSTAHKSTSAVLSDLFGRRRRALFLCFLVIPGATVGQYFLSYTATTFAFTTLKLPPSIGFLANLTSAVTGLTFSLVGGWLGDRYGLKPVAIWPRILYALLVFPAAMLIVQAPGGFVLAATLSFLMVLQAMSGAVTIALIPKCFPAAVRTAGLSIAYATGVAIFGGSAQFIFTWLIGKTGDPLSHVWWVIAANIVTIYAVFQLRPLPDMQDNLPPQDN